MAERCPWTERVINAAGPLDAEVARHVESCAECGAERFAHDELLAAFRGLPRPALPPHFRPHLMVRLETERRRRKISRRRLGALRLYWLAASVICSAVLANLTWSSPNPMQQAPVLFGIAAFVVPIAILLIAIRTNPFELILQTLTRNAADSLTEM
jgi:anti-sigma factor RsiW